MLMYNFCLINIYNHDEFVAIKTIPEDLTEDNILFKGGEISEPHINIIDKI